MRCTVARGKSYRDTHLLFYDISSYTVTTN